MASGPKSSLQLYRDCLRLIRHVAGSSPKAVHLTALASKQFRANKNLTDAQKIHEAKQAAERVLSNYFLYEHVQKDPKLKAVQEKSWEQTEIAEAQYQESLANGDFDATAVESGEDESLFAGEDAEDKPLP